MKYFWSQGARNFFTSSMIIVLVICFARFAHADNSAPILDASKTPMLSTVNENAGVPSGAVGTLISNLVDFAVPTGQVDNVTDNDPGALLGIAITATDAADLTCYYSLNNGATWSPIGAVSASSSLLLAANASDRVYCQPNHNLSGAFPVAVTFRAWDQTSGSDGQLVSTVSTGGTTAFSNATDTAALNVIASPFTSDMFVTTWTVTDGETVTIPTNSDYTYNYTVDWGDSTSADTAQTGNDSHTYVTAGSYIVKITGTFPAISFNNASDAPALTDINQWGTNHWQSMNNAFHGCTGLTTLSATDAPDLSGVTDMGGMFLGATNFNSNIGSWDVSNVTSMAYMFESAESFNQDLSSWNVGNVTTMYAMFNTASVFNNGDTGNDGTHPLSWGSHVVHVLDMGSMFYYDHAFNQDISSWDVSNVANMGSMFQSDDMFNNGGQSMTWGAKTAHVTNMGAMFYGTWFNQDVSDWDTSSVTTMSNMFAFNYAGFDQDLSNWDISNVTDMSSMFDGDTLSSAHYDSLLIKWSKESVQPNVSFSAGNSTYCSVHAVIGRDYLIASPHNWNISDGGTFCGSAPFVTTWDTTKPGIDDSNQITIPTFSGDTYNYNIDWGDGTTTSGATGDAQHTYADSGVYTVKITGTFPRIYFNDGGSSDGQKILSVEQWGTNHWDSMGAAFAGCPNLVVNATDAPDLSGVTNASYMFLNDVSLNQDLSSWNTSHIISMYGMFQSTMSFNQPLNTWNTSSVADMGYMFENDPAFNQPLNHWNTSQVTTMESMFYGDTLFDQDVSSWNISHVTNMNNFFQIGQSGFSLDHYDNLLQAWSQESLQSGVPFSVGASNYCSSAAAARASIISNYSWEISDGGLSPCLHLVTDAPRSSSSGGGYGYVCTDPKATNYDTYASSGNTSCKYSVSSTQAPIKISSIVHDTSIKAITRTLKYGSRGDGVILLQKYLNNHNYNITQTGAGSIGNETTMFGLLTEKAVQKFQKDHGLNPDGIVGSKTRLFMN